MPITTRQLESMIRLAQARAKAELRDLVYVRYGPGVLPHSLQYIHLQAS